MANGRLWSKENPSLTMINREENIEITRDFDVRTKSQNINFQHSADDRDSEEDYPETKDGKI